MRRIAEARRLASTAFLVIAALAAALPSSGQGSVQRPDFWDSPDLLLSVPLFDRAAAAARAAEIVRSMSREERLAQTLMLGYIGLDAPPNLLERVRALGLGGIKIFGWNGTDTHSLARATASFQKAALNGPSAIPLLIATDQEGGWIRHVKGDTSISPGNMAIGATRSARDATLAGYHTGRELALLGINMNFAPDVDLATDLQSTIIGPRAFSSDPKLVSSLAQAYAAGSLMAGVIPTAKHFPGHGDTPLDSHGTLPQIGIDADTLWQRELLPFRSLVKGGIPAVMTGHLAFPEIDSSGLPASLSEYMIGNILRRRLGFDGLVITDDLYMGGAAGNGGILGVIAEALMAGNDMVLLSTAPGTGAGSLGPLVRRMEADSAFDKRVTEAAENIVATKLRYLKPLGKAALVPAEGAADSLPLPEAKAFFKALARRSATLVYGGKNLPFHASGRVALVGSTGDFFAIGSSAFPGAVPFRFPAGAEDAALAASLKELGALLKDCSAAIVCVGDETGARFAEAARAAGKPTAIISVYSPIHVAGTQWADAVVAVYNRSPDSLKAGFDVLKGLLRPSGTLPIHID